MKKLIYSLLLGAGLMACSSVSGIQVHPDSVMLDNQFAASAKIDSLIEPYKDSLASEMNVVIAQAETDYAPARPGSNLGNWMTDALFANQTKTIRLSQPVFCLLNTGGIRSTINRGDVTLGDLYKLMPFDNEIVWVELPVSVIPDIENYLKKTGGEPISNAKLVNGKLEINGWRAGTEKFWVITSDYLMNGGDKMDFFRQKSNVNMTGKLMRDALIEEARNQDVLWNDTTIRIHF